MNSDLGARIDELGPDETLDIIVSVNFGLPRDGAREVLSGFNIVEEAMIGNRFRLKATRDQIKDIDAKATVIDIMKGEGVDLKL